MGFRHSIEVQSLKAVLESICRASPLEKGSVTKFVKRHAPTKVQRKNLISMSLVQDLVAEVRLDALKELWAADPVVVGENLRLLDQKALLKEKYVPVLEWLEIIGIPIRSVERFEWEKFVMNGDLGLAKFFYGEHISEHDFFMRRIFDDICSKKDVEHDVWKETILWFTTLDDRFVAHFTGDAEHCTLYYHITSRPFISTREKVDVTHVRLCSICDENQSDVITRCEHQFCAECITAWHMSGYNRTCPMCRAQVGDEVFPIVPPPPSPKKKRAPRRKKKETEGAAITADA